MRILVINSGSSSIKFRLFEMENEILLLSGELERIGASNSHFSCYKYTASHAPEEHMQDLPIADHAAGLQLIFTYLKNCSMLDSMHSLTAIGHRVVHGGETFQTPTLIDDEVISAIKSMIPLAPLHNPANLAGIEAVRQLYPELPQVAVFDTAFFQTLPPHAYRYALQDDLYQQHHVRRYGFHGTSHQYIAKQAADYLQQPLENLKLITLHLGNGASAAAIRDGICIDTSMGMTPLEGLIMGSRCGDLDPSITFYLSRTLGMPLNDIETLFNQNSGLKGLCGASDMREIHQLAAQGSKAAQLAIEMYCYRICKYIGGYYTILGGLNALIFTAGIGENDPLIRQTICQKLAILGVNFDEQRNQSRVQGSFHINEENSKVTVLVVPTNEELEIARQVVAVIKTNSKTE